MDRRPRGVRPASVRAWSFARRSRSGAPSPTLLEQVAAYPLTVGIRRLIQDEPVGFARQPSFIDGVRAVGEVGLPFDICVRAAERGDVAPLVDACPDVSFVLDHLGKPDIAGGEWEPWRDQLVELARRPNVVCKLSGSTSEAGPGWQRGCGPAVSRACAGIVRANRCMFGSDWPVATLTTAYPRWLDLVTDGSRGLFRLRNRCRVRRHGATGLRTGGGLIVIACRGPELVGRTRRRRQQVPRRSSTQPRARRGRRSRGRPRRQ